MGIIYALLEPDTHEVRYVGQTVKTLAHRVSLHRQHARLYGRTYVHRWLRSIDCHCGSMILEEDIPAEELDAAECWWIAYHREQGARLCNLTDGGGGLKGYVQSEEHKRKIGDANRGRPCSPEQRAQISATLTGRPGNKCKPGCDCVRHQRPVREKCPPGCTCGRHDSEQLARAAEKRRVKCPPGCNCWKHSESHRQKLREAMTGERSHRYGTKHTEETLAKMREAAQARPKQTHCKRGHPLSGDNIWQYGNSRACKACRQIVKEAA